MEVAGSWERSVLVCQTARPTKRQESHQNCNGLRMFFGHRVRIVGQLFQIRIEIACTLQCNAR